MNVNPLYIHIPAHLLPSRLPFLLNRKLQPEVACQDISLDKLDFELLGDCAIQLSEQGLTTILHAPYSGFNPGSSRKRIRKLSHSIAEKSLLLAEKLKARRIVFHPGLPFGCSGKKLDDWLLHSVSFWPEFIARAKEIDCVICIENIYAATPETFFRLLSAIDSPYMGHVFDIGHWHLFGTTQLTTWLERLGPYLKHLHLHDNHGERDEHLAIGQGDIPFSELFNWLKDSSITPTMTLENHSLPNTEISLQSIYKKFPELNS
jgi:sugar phosphate isomerase/epimerase